MTPAEMLAREIIRLDSRGGRDTEDRADFNEDEWPSEAAVRVALNVVAAAENVSSRWERKTWDPMAA